MDVQIIDVTNPLWLQIVEKIPHDIYQLPEYLNLEAKRTKTTPEAIVIGDELKLLFVPYLRRNCAEIFSEKSPDSEIFDIISPYGYPGMLVSEAAANDREFRNLAMNELKKTLQSVGVCSAFLRLHPILNENLTEIFSPEMFTFNGETISVDLTLSAAQIWSDTNPKQRNRIKKCQRLGMTARVVKTYEYLDVFVDIYKETMERVGALGSYFSFDYKYFLEMQDHFFEHMFLCLVEMGNEVACAGLYTEVQGIVQALFCGTRNKYYQFSPTSLEMDYMRFWAKQRGNKYFHLGGGVGGVQDTLYKFKSTFSQQRHKFYTLRLITDAEKYGYLVETRAKSLNIQPQTLWLSNFFPVYRTMR